MWERNQNEILKSFFCIIVIGNGWNQAETILKTGKHYMLEALNWGSMVFDN